MCFGLVSRITLLQELLVPHISHDLSMEHDGAIIDWKTAKMIDDALSVLDIYNSAWAFQQTPSVSVDLCTYQRLTFFVLHLLPSIDCPRVTNKTKRPSGYHVETLMLKQVLF